ncbi:MAG: U32 family peptidase [Christensenellaceae bacterium]|jgi:putative protease|nr:U32 family peptidase [Christensenellaceae bacterium]
MKIELLSPAGSYDALRSAVMCKADAVYLGLTEFNARMASENFDSAILESATAFCKLYGVRFYIVLNTSVKNSEFSHLQELIRYIASVRPDGIIISDPGIIPLINECDSQIPLHMSTQVGVHNSESAEFFIKLGADRSVVSRETSLKDIKDISAKFPTFGIEYFVHGALCVSFSGGCLMSYVQNGGSGNRGKCLQACRQKFTLSIDDTYSREGFCLSTSDLCLIDKLDELVDAGVTTFKIEGRLRRSEYTAQTTLSYKNVMDNVSTPKKELSMLKRIFNRGDFCRGYIYSDTLDIMSLDISSHIGERCGSVSRVFMMGGYTYAEIKSRHEFSVGDGLKILRSNKEVGGADVHSVKKIEADRYVVPVSSEVKANDIVYLTTDKKQIDYLNSISSKIKIDVGITAHKGSELSIYVESQTAHAEITSDFLVVSADNAPISADDIKRTISAIGDTEFVVKEIQVFKDDNIFIPMSTLNSLKHQAINKLRKEIINAWKPTQRKNFFQPLSYTYNKDTSKVTIVECSDFGDLDNISDNMCIVYRPLDFSSTAALEFFTKLKKKNNCTPYLALPKLLSYVDKESYIEFFNTEEGRKFGIYADNYGAVEFARARKIGYIAGLGLNIFNTNAMDILYDADYIIISAELSKGDQELLLAKGGIPFVSGHIPLMTLAHCPVYLVTGRSCAYCNFSPTSTIKYADSHYTYKALRYRINTCQFVIYNPVCTNTVEKFNQPNRKHGLFFSKILLGSPKTS